MKLKKMSEKAGIEVGEGGEAMSDSRARGMKVGKVVEEDEIEDKATVKKDDSGESAWSVTKGEGESMGLPNVVSGRGGTNGLGKEGGEDEESSSRKSRPVGQGDRRKSNKDGGGSGAEGR